MSDDLKIIFSAIPLVFITFFLFILAIIYLELNVYQKQLILIIGMINFFLSIGYYMELFERLYSKI